MKKIILPFFCLLTNVCIGATWIELEGVPKEISNIPIHRYIDIESLRKDGNIFSIWMRNTWSNTESQVASLIYVDCNSQTNRYDEFIVVKEQFRTLRGTYFPIPLEKYTTGRQLFNMYCK
jgi:hypothetical protein